MKVTRWAVGLVAGASLFSTPNAFAQYPLHSQSALPTPTAGQVVSPTRPYAQSYQPPGAPAAPYWQAPASGPPPANTPPLPVAAPQTTNAVGATGAAITPPAFEPRPEEAATFAPRKPPNPPRNRVAPPMSPAISTPSAPTRNHAQNTTSRVGNNLAEDPDSVPVFHDPAVPLEGGYAAQGYAPGFVVTPRRPRHHLRGFAPKYDHTPGWATSEESVVVGGGVAVGGVAVDDGADYGLAAGGIDACCEPPPARCAWYGSYDSLLLTRDNENEVWFSYDTAQVGSQILGSLDADMGWRFGTDIRVGKYIDDGCHSVEMVYWGIFSGVEEANAYGADMAGNLDASLVFDSLSYDPGGGATSVASLFNNAERHQLVRSYRAHNVELNTWRHAVDQGCGASCSKDGCGKCGGHGSAPARLSWLFGFRYMNYSEGFHFAADPYDRTFGNQASEELRYDVSVNNHLIGFQVGGMGEFCLSDRWQFNSTVKAGVMANRLELTSFIGSSQRAAYVDNVASPYNGERWNVRTTKNDVSLLGELDLGMRYRWNNYWNITGGYRAVGLAGVGLSTNQVPVYFADLGGVRQIDSNGSLILHGVLYWGAEYNY